MDDYITRHRCRRIARIRRAIRALLYVSLSLSLSLSLCMKRSDIEVYISFYREMIKISGRKRRSFSRVHIFLSKELETSEKERRQRNLNEEYERKLLLLLLLLSIAFRLTRWMAKVKI